MKKSFIILLFAATIAFAEWSEPVMVPYPISCPGEDYYPCLSLDGQDLYFTSIRGGYGDDDIYVSHWQGDQWGPAENLGPVINDDQRNLSPSISPDGDTLYFVSYGRPGGYGWYDIWKSWKTESGWAEPVNMGPNINTPGIEWTVYIAPDNNHLYLASNGWPGSGVVSLYVSTRTDSGWSLPQNIEILNYLYITYSVTMPADMQSIYYSQWHYVSWWCDIFMSTWDGENWTPGIQMSPPINSYYTDDGPTVSADGLTLYFASRRDTSGGIYDQDEDIYVSHWVSSVNNPAENQPSSFEFNNCYPNPFNCEITFEFTLQKDSPFWVKIYDINGRKIFSDYLWKASAGINIYKWSAIDNNNKPISSGIYLVYLQAENKTSQIKKIIKVI